MVGVERQDRNHNAEADEINQDGHENDRQRRSVFCHALPLHPDPNRKSCSCILHPKSVVESTPSDVQGGEGQEVATLGGGSSRVCRLLFGPRCSSLQGVML